MKDIKIVKIESESYPESLKKISDAPKVLYYKGILPSKDEKIIAVVGTRRPSPYGQQATIQIAGELTNENITIISGMAPGIDTFAHKICVEKQKRTIAVLGTGLDEKSIYPQQNLELSRKIIETGGCLISELKEGTHGSKFTFPRRNRIVSALSAGVLVVEAKEKSGSLITANYAKKQNKKLFAIPGPIFSLNSAGPNRLIKEGAKIVQGPKDILNELNLVQSKKQKEIFGETSEENLILKALKEEALYIDKIIEKTNLGASTVATSLALLEISGKIRHLGGNTYSLN
ncbi:MAG: DNA-protecting protein DprA [Candidatus Staskawiczbacteria bacterium]|nr:DNA-protecting protein DprA [Candidatus Staskawiczbacteria bacterium]